MKHFLAEGAGCAEQLSLCPCGGHGRRPQWGQSAGSSSGQDGRQCWGGLPSQAGQVDCPRPMRKRSLWTPMVWAPTCVCRISPVSGYHVPLHKWSTNAVLFYVNVTLGGITWGLLWWWLLNVVVGASLGRS